MSASSRGRELFDWESRWRPEPGSDPGPIKRGAGMAFMMFRSGVGPSSAIVRVNSDERYTLFVGVTDIGPGAKTTMALIAAEELGVPLSQVEVVWGDTDLCPYSVGESGSRTTTMTGYAVVQAALDLKGQIAERGHADRRRGADRISDPDPQHSGNAAHVFRRPLRRSGSGRSARQCADHQVRRRARVGSYPQSASCEGPDPWARRCRG